MTKNIRNYSFGLLLLLSICCLLSCNNVHKHYHIGMSQCAAGEWRDQMNNEVQREVLLHDDITLDLLTSHDNAEQQIRDIDSLIRIPVDVLIVSPTDPVSLTPSIEKAYDAGIPVILVDRDVKTEKYAAYIGGDNKEVGRMGAKYVSKIYEDYKTNNGITPTVLELQGDKSITPVKDRHTGFMQEMNRKGITFSSVVCNWHQHLAAATVDSLIDNNLLPAIIFTHNDNMAIGVVDRLSERDKLGMAEIVGVDGSPQFGMKLVSDNSIRATVMYPTGGSEAIRTAIDILEGRKYDRTQYIKPIVIDENNVVSLREQEIRADQLTHDIILLGERLTDYSKRNLWQMSMLIILLILSAGLAVALFYVVHHHRANKEMQHEVVESMASAITSSGNNKEENTDISEQIETPVDGIHSTFITSLRDLIQQNINNPNFSVEDMGEKLGMGRSQFFRKTKLMTGYTPNDLLRTMRLQQAVKLLCSTDMNISDISHRVGFNNPSYFTRAFRDQFKMSPKEYRENGQSRIE